MTRAEIIALYRAQGPNWALYLASGWTESRLDPTAVSGAGCRGIAGFGDSTWQEVQTRGWVPTNAEPTEPKWASIGQRKYLDFLYSQFGQNWAAALAAYNLGPTKLRKLRAREGSRWEAALPRETWSYVRQVFALRDFFVVSESEGWWHGQGQSPTDQ